MIPCKCAVFGSTNPSIAPLNNRPFEKTRNEPLAKPAAGTSNVKRPRALEDVTVVVLVPLVPEVNTVDPEIMVVPRITSEVGVITPAYVPTTLFTAGYCGPPLKAKAWLSRKTKQIR